MCIDQDILQYVGRDPADAPFRDWLKRVNTHVEQAAGFGIFDLPDMPYRDWFDDGLEPDQTVEAIKDEL